MRAEGARKFEWLPAVLAAAAFVAFAIAFAYELVSYQRKVFEWAGGDLDSRTRLAAANLADPLKTQDFHAVRTIGEACEEAGFHLLVRSGRGGVVFDSRPQRDNVPVIFSAPSPSGEYWVSVGVPAKRVSAPFSRALRGFALAGSVGVAGVLLFFFVIYRQRVRIRELAKVERFRREFITDVSHEIKTPLTGILGAADMMEGDSPLVPLIKKETKRLNGLVQSILDLARLEREGEVLNLAETDLWELVSETVEGLKPMATAGGIDLKCERPTGEALTARVDAQMISQALGNLIVNAIRHSGSKDVIVSVGRSGKEARITVEDHGIGIPSEHAERIFERFHRVDPSRAAETGGAGLGLAIVRRIARLHGGDVTLSAARPQGCRFAICIPVAKS